MSLERLQLPEGYQPKLDIMETEIAIKLLKDTFERELANQLNLTRVSDVFQRKSTVFPSSCFWPLSLRASNVAFEWLAITEPSP